MVGGYYHIIKACARVLGVVSRTRGIADSNTGKAIAREQHLYRFLPRASWIADFLPALPPERWGIVHRESDLRASNAIVSQKGATKVGSRSRGRDSHGGGRGPRYAPGRAPGIARPYIVHQCGAGEIVAGTGVGRAPVT